VSQGALEAGVPALFDVAISNDADTSAHEQFRVTLLVDGKEVTGGLTIPGLQYRGNHDHDSHEATIRFTLANPGSRSVQLFVDADNDVREANEENNTYAETFTWLGSSLSVDRIVWQAKSGGDLSSVGQGTAVNLVVYVPGLTDQKMWVEVCGVGSDNPIEWVEMHFMGGNGTAEWMTVLGSNPKYKFKVLGVDSPELEVIRSR